MFIYVINMSKMKKDVALAYSIAWSHKKCEGGRGYDVMRRGGWEGRRIEKHKVNS